MVGGLLGGLRLGVLALVAQLPARRAQRLRGGADLLAGLRRALIDLLAHAHLRLLAPSLTFSCASWAFSCTCSLALSVAEPMGSG